MREPRRRRREILMKDPYPFLSAGWWEEKEVRTVEKTLFSQHSAFFPIKMIFFLPLFHSAGFSHKGRRQLGRNINLRLRKNTGSAWEMQEGNGMGQGHFGTNENRLLFLPFFSSGGKRENYHCSTSPFPSAIFSSFSPDVDFPINHAQLFIR